MKEKYPQKPGIDFILKQAFYYWNRTLLYQLVFSIVYFTIFFTVFLYISNRFGVYDQLLNATFEYLKIGPKGLTALQTELATIKSTENYEYTMLGMLAVSAFLFPLNLGFYQIYRKIDLKEQLELSDLFVGYNGLNFFRYTSYFVFWYLVSDMLKITVFLPFVWILITLFIAPLMFFQNKTIFEGIALSWKVLKLYFIEIFVCTLVAVLFKYVGFMLFLVGALFTFPFWNAMIYTLYKTFFTEEKSIN
ncbi:hypothetical protein CHRY9390_01535 [Chryseobacterium aquaeductus]|uniref:Beta-carotene 15,15'-monooxygenase n=1 Tax=Chryseobacterium aquaeductus TaxID=2675056 RepID=A0A9N8MN23_9FLAO|nr:hypothetical protein [Chryseobacterium aquaeductus]CAA7330862.1 hypothetical protein CHRY9390_01535 [Chryseobacterium potabilaquae]CAD7806611.1 hypothetical protein CHRY9390_01535 [Chryseobacterium aquaeductus]